jgi:formylglycine-generating enzyme required for sulfatase activity
MSLILKGEFLRGSDADDRLGRADERPQRKVRITQPFLLGKFEVTQAQWNEVMRKNPSRFNPKGAYDKAVKGVDTHDHPVDSVPWLEAIRFCNKLSERHGLAPYYRIEGNTVTIKGGDGYRLPTEAEWEYACRAGTSTRWSFGDREADLKDHGWFEGNSGGTTQPVGKKKPNAWGLYDMHGNVPEWCWDRYGADYYRDSPGTNPTGAGGGLARVLRGGSWDQPAHTTRSAARSMLVSTYGPTTSLGGLRVARNVP